MSQSSRSSNRLIWLLIPIAFAAGVAVGVLGLLWATGGNSTPSQDVGNVVPTLSLDDDSAEPTAETTEEMAEPTEEMADPTEEPTEEAADAESASAFSPERALFRITTDESEARFKIDETLVGNEIVVVGTTNDIAGDIIVNFANPAESQLGEVAVSARTLKTDEEFRNQSIRGRILLSSQDEYEFITFAPTEFVSLTSDPVSVGDTLEFEITGNLTIRGNTNTVTFPTTVTVVSADRIEGFATTDVLYSDYGITIQAPPTVSNIGDVVTIELDFVALLVDES
ncbi:MAG: YceI family protein [Anaerolineaceae bacterium]|nr:YceI family protein [Anaerolineaceae bacterium]